MIMTIIITMIMIITLVAMINDNANHILKVASLLGAAGSTSLADRRRGAGVGGNQRV